MVNPNRSSVYFYHTNLMAISRFNLETATFSIWILQGFELRQPKNLRRWLGFTKLFFFINFCISLRNDLDHDRMQTSEPTYNFFEIFFKVFSSSDFERISRWSYLVQQTPDLNLETSNIYIWLFRFFNSLLSDSPSNELHPDVRQANGF